MSLGEILLIPGVTDPLTQLKSLLFKQGQAGGIWVPSLSPTMISSESFGTGVQTFLDLSGNGKNATQASSGSRPAWGRVPKSGRRNLLLQTGDFTNAAWTKQTVTTPDSSTIAFVASATSPAGDGNRIVQTATVGERNGRTFTASIFVPAVGGWSDPTAILRFTGVGGIGPSEIIVTPTSQEQIISYTWTASSGSFVGIAMNADKNVTITGFRNPQVEESSVRTTPQKVTTAFDVTETGQRDCYYLQPDGVDDGMATASIDFSGTDKVTVFAAVRKLSDAATGMLVELSANSDSGNDGAFNLVAPGDTGAHSYRMRSRGNAASPASAGNSVFAAAPDNAVLCGQSVISTDTLSLRRNGVQVGTSALDQGSGNYGNYPLYFFRRNLATLPANLQCFALIVAGGSYPLSTIQRVERILSRYTPGVSL